MSLGNSTIQSYDFRVKHEPGKLHVVPDTLSRLFAFERHHEMAKFKLAPICINVPDDPALQTAVLPGHIKYPQKNLMFNRSELFHVKSVYVIVLLTCSNR